MAADVRPDPSPTTALLAGLDAAQIGRRLESGGLRSTELVAVLLRRIGDLDRDHSGPRLRSVLAVCDDVEAVAAERDAERDRGQVRGPLHGVPILVKDNCDTDRGAGTSCGSLALCATRPARDASAVRRLREAGLIVLGKTNLSEWANFRSPHSASGWSAVGGQTRNPHVLDRSPGGSSSGSGAAVAAGLAPLAVGTETDGSILCPAAFCGVVGIKPTVGRVSRSGVVPIATSQDTVGPMARSVLDAALLLDVLAGRDPEDRATHRRGAGPVASAAAALQPPSLRGLRLGVARAVHFGYSQRADRLVEDALDALRGAGVVLVDPADIPTAADLRDSPDELTVLLHEFKHGVEAYLRARPGPRDACPRTLEELIAFNSGHREQELSWFGQELLVQAAATTGLDSPAYRRARSRGWRRARRDGIDQALRDHDVAALVVPTMGPAPVTDLVNGDADGGSGYQAAAIAGTPAITLPVGESCGLPVGLSLLGPAFSEVRLVGLAAAIERELAVRLVPRYLPAVPVD
ncbi:MAG TPA: amidase [Verrucomicrobiae bacterium]|nr:amidase [Verrucomicrobiae bacterium]